ncbi:leucyl/phenylalanyl-tRNA--protein transferase [Kitasatospora sp. NPDC051853]|uniref:leucyl/phenylalanyl-tRNA--protein transferase n=1 Tax=Kitasatospora sp. NPDC051853 TaxID=3364058 RepID=UPI0037B104FB
MPWWEELELEGAPADGPVAFGGALDPVTLLGAYRAGLFPFPAGDPAVTAFNEVRWEDGPAVVVGGADPYALAWWSPDPRPVLAAGALRERGSWELTVGRAFGRVLEECRVGREPRWLTDELADALVELHRRGWAESAEVWEDGELVGGVYGVRVGPVLSLDSMFHRSPGAGRAAVAGLGARFAEAGGRVLDVQWDGPHVRRLGAEGMDRSAFLALLREPEVGPLRAVGEG